MLRENCMHVHFRVVGSIQLTQEQNSLGPLSFITINEDKDLSPTWRVWKAE